MDDGHGPGRMVTAVDEQPVEMQTLRNPRAYADGQIEEACAIADALGLRTFTLCEPPPHDCGHSRDKHGVCIFCRRHPGR